jgi:spore maturation protein CgeB
VRFVLFYHSFSSCWNHGNAHFLRGLARELVRGGHQVRVCEPTEGWSRTNALAESGGSDALAEAASLVPGVEIRLYDVGVPHLDKLIDGADVVIVHEWNEPSLVAALGNRRIGGGEFLLLFHDTHHRAVTAADEIGRFDLQGYDGVLAFGEVLREVYLARGWGRRVFTWHEAADTALFRPHPEIAKEVDLIWIGNWGDDERTQELETYLVAPSVRLNLRTEIYGVRYPGPVRDALARQGIVYKGWLPNHRAPEAFARAHMTVHVPRRPYVEALPGIPTIRMFEALACGIPLVSAPWRDTESLFPAESYLKARNGEEMTAALSMLRNDDSAAAEIAHAGLAAITARQTCAHRVDELLAIVRRLQGDGHAAFSRSEALGKVA